MNIITLTDESGKVLASLEEHSNFGMFKSLLQEMLEAEFQNYGHKDPKIITSDSELEKVISLGSGTIMVQSIDEDNDEFEEGFTLNSNVLYKF